MAKASFSDQLVGLLEKEPGLAQDLVSRIDDRIRELQEMKKALLGRISGNGAPKAGRGPQRTTKKRATGRRGKVEIDKEEFAGLMNAGYTDAKLAAHYGVSAATIYNKKKKFGLVGTNKPGRRRSMLAAKKR
jgi:hypothetical protein